MMGALKLLHLLSVIVWVGGMFFAYVVLRPTAVDVLQPPERLRLWDGVFRRFFRWVWAAIGALLVTGTVMIAPMEVAPIYVHIMYLLGFVMMGIYLSVYFGCYRPMSRMVAEQRWPDAGKMLARIRMLVAANLSLGLLIVAEVMMGRGY
jgi:uncharacterized membrane protein